MSSCETGRADEKKQQSKKAPVVNDIGEAILLLKDYKDQGLLRGWTVRYDNSRECCKFVGPNGKTFYSIDEAVKLSKELASAPGMESSSCNEKQLPTIKKSVAAAPPEEEKRNRGRPPKKRKIDGGDFEMSDEKLSEKKIKKEDDDIRTDFDKAKGGNDSHRHARTTPKINEDLAVAALGTPRSRVKLKRKPGRPKKYMHDDDEDEDTTKKTEGSSKGKKSVTPDSARSSKNVGGSNSTHSGTKLDAALKRKRKLGRPPKSDPDDVDTARDEPPKPRLPPQLMRKKKKTSGGKPPPVKPPAKKEIKKERNHEDEEEDSIVSCECMPDPDSDPELAFDKTKMTTMHWDPTESTKIGWRIRVLGLERAGRVTQYDKKLGFDQDGRIIQYDAYSHKHKIQFVKSKRSIWLRLRCTSAQVATRLVWAHVKGYPWWPALVMESDDAEINPKDGFVFLSFIDTQEVATLRDTPEYIRPFTKEEEEWISTKSKKKRNARSIALALKEEQVIQRVRNQAARSRAAAAFGMADPIYMGKRVKIFRNDVNYPYGDTVIGTVRQYSYFHKKWLLSFEISDKTKKKYDSAWINIKAKECNLEVMDKKKKLEPSDMNIIPFLHGFDSSSNYEGKSVEGSDAYLAKLLSQRCRGCVDTFRNSHKITCQECQGSYHLNCVDPPISVDAWQKMEKDGVSWKCPKCTLCRGCYQKDIVFGSHPYPVPRTVSWPANEPLHLCSMCVQSYEIEKYCPNCAHTWDDIKYHKVIAQLQEDEESGVLALPSKYRDATKIKGINVDPAVYYAESFVWGYTEEDMLVCDDCNLWVHAACADLTEKEYNLTTNGEHPIYSKQFLCRMCCRRRCKKLIEALKKEDNAMLFAQPVSLSVAPNYHDVIKQPMDLQTMAFRAENEEYNNVTWVRESFELMVLNALTFNRYYTLCWNEAKRFYHTCITNVFDKINKVSNPGTWDEAIKLKFAAAEEAVKMEEERVQQDESTEKKDLVAGSEVKSTVTLPPLRESPPDLSSCLPFKEVRLKPVDAFYCSWMEGCFICGSSGAADTMLFCVDCGEAFHSFCANVPIHSMEMSSVTGWRCPNCKICEISGEAPKDELRMLFCEMCDRGFSMDLLDPPLKKVPSGIWVCGQCVDCKTCHNTSEPKGVSLTHWSCDPEKCYRCGGCKGIVRYDKSMKCSVCSKFLRNDDDDFVSCSDCDAKVHLSCDPRAAMVDPNVISRAQKAQKAKTVKYRCPPCFAKHNGSSSSHGSSKKPIKGYSANKIGQSIRKNMHDQAWLDIIRGKFRPDFCEYSPVELHYRLVEALEWNTREIWKDEYTTILQEGIRVYSKAKTSFGDPRIIIQRMKERQLDLPSWMSQRACRFIALTKRSKWDEVGYSGHGMKSCVITAKLAAAFLEVSCRVMDLSAKKYVKCYSRLTSLLKRPHASGQFEPPVDLIRSKKHKGIMQEKEVLRNLGQHLNLDMSEYAESNEGVQDVIPNQPPETTEEQELEEYKLAAPLCGWNHLTNMNEKNHVWKDPRECSLCHLCGDDDAGFEDDDPVGPVAVPTSFEEVQIPKLGRLLPMSEGLWVHTNCAIWSSEVWEDPSGGRINAVEKARSRGAQLKCFGCGRPGATVGCNKANCPFNYHFPCSKACGAVFTSKKEMFCSLHSEGVSNVLQKGTFEPMKTLIIAPEKQKTTTVEKDTMDSHDGSTMCTRVGSLVLHSLGSIEQKNDGFHNENYIFPVGYLATRIFWSTCNPRTRTVYILRIQKSDDNKPIFSITSGDNPSSVIRSQSIFQAYATLMDRVKRVNEEYFSLGDSCSKLPTVRRTRKKAFGLNGAQFFGIGLDLIREMVENLPGVEAVVAPLTNSSPKYLFCYVQPTIESIVDLQRKRVAVAAERALENSSGCARTEGRMAVARSGGSGRITRALVRSAAEEEVPSTGTDQKRNESRKTDTRMSQAKYQMYKSVPMEQRLAARRSHIHGWGLFTKVDIKKDDIIVEYMGEIIRQCVADKREKEYEISGEGSCYMFRLDLQRIVDATVIGCMARFMNHCCQPNAYAKVITVDTDIGPDKKIAVFALRSIAAGEEITYDYKFPVEDGSLRCSCGAPNCIGRMN